MGKLRIGVIVNPGKNPDFVNNLILQLLNKENIEVLCYESPASETGLSFSDRITKLFCSSTIIRNHINAVAVSGKINSSEIESSDIILNFSSYPFNHQTKAPILSVSWMEGVHQGIIPCILKAISKKENTISIHLANQLNTIYGFAKIKTILHSYKQSEKVVIRESMLLINQVINNISHGRDYKSNSILSGNNSGYSVVNFLLSKWTSLIKKRFANLFGTVKWNVGQVNLPLEEIIFSKNNSIKTEWMKENNHPDFKADPFGIYENGNSWIVYEYFDSGKNKGILKLKKDTESENILLEENYHLSYPYLFKSGDEWYCIPEKNKSHKVDLYKFNLTENKLSFYKTILNNFEAVDPSIIQYNGRCWLFCNDASNNGADLRLHIFYADTIDSTWKAHPMNPVKTDICSSRPAGTMFIQNGKLFRPSQDSSGGYGSAVVINEIIKLNVDEFEEIEIKKIYPEKFSGPYSDGIHTLSACGPFTLIDGKIIHYSILNLFKPIFHRAV